MSCLCSLLNLNKVFDFPVKANMVCLQTLLCFPFYFSKWRGTPYKLSFFENHSFHKIFFEIPQEWTSCLKKISLLLLVPVKSKNSFRNLSKSLKFSLVMLVNWSPWNRPFQDSQKSFLENTITYLRSPFTWLETSQR